MYPLLHSLYVLFMFWIIYKIISSSQIRMYAVQSSDLTIAHGNWTQQQATENPL